MRIVKDNDMRIDLYGINHGDVVETTCDTYMIIKDDDGSDFRALSLTTFTPSYMESTIFDLFDSGKMLGDIIEVYKNENIELKLNRR